MDPPLRIPLADVSPDGTLDAAQLAQMVAAVSPEGQRSESLPDAGCHLDVHMVTNCMSHTMNSSLQILCGRRFAEARQV